MCGVAAGSLEEVYSLLEALQHRGQEGAGIVWVKDGKLVGTYTHGLVRDLKLEDRGGISIGHVRYATSGVGIELQPVIHGSLAVAFNGNIINFKELEPASAWDGEALAKALFRSYKKHNDLYKALKEVLPRIKGSYSMIVLTNKNEIAIARDPYGFKPLAFGEGRVASETSALELLGFKWREIDPNTILILRNGKIEIEDKIVENHKRKAVCVFEYIYMMRPDSMFSNIEVHLARVRMGEELAREAPADADVVIPVPDSGRSAALGYSKVSGIPLDEGLVKNRYLGRSFILPPGVRERVARLKYGVVKSAVKGKRVVVVDDSIIRGTTMKRIVNLLRSYGAREVHVRIASPKVIRPCFMGIDFPSTQELIANRPGFEKYIGADSLQYLSVEGLIKALRLPKDSLCLSCFTGLYPFKIDDKETFEILKMRRGRGSN